MAAIRDHIRKKWVPDFEWAEYGSPAGTARLEKPLRECTVGFVSTCGAYLRDTQRPFLENGGKGDHSFRELPFPVDKSRLAIAH